MTTGGILEIEAPDRGLFILKQHTGVNSLKLSHLLIQTGEETKTTFFDNKSGLAAEFHQPSRFGALMDGRIAESTFNKLFIRHAPGSRYFTMIAENIPRYQIWQVRGDSFDMAGKAGTP